VGCTSDFDVRGAGGLVEIAGRRKLVSLYERRKEESWKHPVTGYSLTYRRLFELEVVTGKEWSGERVCLVSWYCDEVLWQK